TPTPPLALEAQTDKPAKQPGLDPADMRRRIVCEPFTKTANHLTVTTIGLGECIDKVVEASGWREKWRGWQPTAAGRGPRRRGVRLACSAYMTRRGNALCLNNMPLLAATHPAHPTATHP